jgi:hypothetical protein
MVTMFFEEDDRDWRYVVAYLALSAPFWVFAILVPVAWVSWGIVLVGWAASMWTARGLHEKYWRKS